MSALGFLRRVDTKRARAHEQRQQQRQQDEREPATSVLSPTTPTSPNTSADGESASKRKLLHDLLHRRKGRKSDSASASGSGSELEKGSNYYYTTTTSDKNDGGGGGDDDTSAPPARRGTGNGINERIQPVQRSASTSMQQQPAERQRQRLQRRPGPAPLPAQGASYSTNNIASISNDSGLGGGGGWGSSGGAPAESWSGSGSGSTPMRRHHPRTPSTSTTTSQGQGGKLRKPAPSAGPGKGHRPSYSTSSSATASTAAPARTSPSLNSNKPLPSPPPSEVEENANGTISPKTPPPVLSLKKIMATLSDDEIEKLFSGAPQYFARSEGHFTGAPHPSVAFPWDEVLPIRDLSDHTLIESSAWSCVTAWPHITRSINSPHSSAKEKKKAHFYPRCRERPNMLSMQGLEKGTMGYQAALEISVADALQEEQFGFGGIGSEAPIVVEQRQRMLTSKEGLRHLEEAAILDQLIKNCERYKSDRIHKNISSTLYNELFLGILHPPTRVVDHRDPYSLSVQIQALLKVLATPNVWIDFSHVEWRIRLGQILWGSYDGDDVETDIDIEDAETNEKRREERYWLLLQILLACELLIRLDAITEGDELGIESIKPAEIHRFEKDATLAVKWSMHLARAWLENINIIETEVDAGQPDNSRHHLSGWLASLTGRMTLHGHGSSHANGDKVTVYTIQGSHPQRQVDGLTQFARKLRWPEVDTYTSRIADNVEKCTKATPIHTPIDETPMSASTTRSSYFEAARTAASIQRQPSRRRKIAAALHPSGWLSKSYISGFMLPGEGLQHFMMATLLENDKEAMDRLGPMANLCGGFVYSGKSFWSTACVVGRVLAAGKGAAECMGWISSDVVPEDLGDGWVNIDVNEIRDDVKNTGKKARLWGKTFIERESAVLGDADRSSVLPADFIIPFENNYTETPPAMRVELRALKFLAPVDSLHTTPTEEKTTPFSEMSRVPELHTYPASISFAVSQADEEFREVQLALSQDVYFVTAHPCKPSSHIKIVKSPSSPTIQQVDVSSTPRTGKVHNQTIITGHPLHKYFTYTVVHLSDLLAKYDTSSLDDLLQDTPSYGRRPSLTPGLSAKTKPRVLVIDCITGFSPPPQSANDAPLSPSSPVMERGEDRFGAMAQMHLESRRRQFGSDMEIMVRALCAEKGWNAIISRRRRGCLACAIREAGALAWKVIIRVD